MATPRNIDVFSDAFYVTWNEDGHESVYMNRYLRGNCGCADCVSERTGKRVVGEEQVAADVQATDVQRVGNYAIQVYWSDGHNTGIYPFERLRQICPCSECRGKQG